MDGYELHGHLSEQLFSAIVDYFANFSSSVGSVSEEIYSLQAVYFSYTYIGEVTWGSVDKDKIIAAARPAKGRNFDGTIVDGFVFEVKRKGTAPATGNPTIKRIFAKLQSDAELTGTGSSFVSFDD